jgi:acyl-CoA synthetase (AMP-forming)/AMP-acid ligase II
MNRQNNLIKHTPLTTSFEKANNIVDVLRNHSLHIGDKKAAIFVQNPNKNDDTSISYCDLDLKAQRIALWLQAQFPIGSRILLLYTVSLNFAVSFFGCLYAGMIAVPAPVPGKYRHQQYRVKKIAEDADVSAIFADSADIDNVKSWAKMENLDRVYCLATDIFEFESSKSWKMPFINKDTLALLQYTSGSTGEPKGVMISHHNLLQNVASFRRGIGFTCETRFGGWIPLYHDMGLIAQLLPALFLGSTYVMMKPITFLKRPHFWLQMLDKYRIHHSCAPNFAFDYCIQRITAQQIADLDLSCWKFIINGSEPIQASTMKTFVNRFASAGVKEEFLCPCYGMAESTVYISGYSSRRPVISCANVNYLEQNKFKPATLSESGRDLVSCGVPLDYDVRIVDPQTLKVLKSGEIGEIWLKGESVSRGYWNNQLATDKTFKGCTSDGDGNYLKTGDLGFQWHEELYVTGRIKEVIIINGRNHYPQDIEHEIRLRHPELRSRFGAVFSIPSSQEGEKLIVTHDLQGSYDQKSMYELAISIKITIQEEFGLKVSGIIFLKPGSVLRTTSGKIQRTAMRQLFIANALVPLYRHLDPEIQNL